MKDAFLVLANGRVFKGKSFGHDGEVLGEIVFTTAMTGAVETLTDPSYFGQIVTMTFPLVGGAGVNEEDFESGKSWAKGVVIKHPCKNPSNFRSQGDIEAMLKKHKVTGICDFDVRALSKIIRDEGVMGAKIMFSEPTKVDVEDARQFVIKGATEAVSMQDALRVECQNKNLKKVALIDFGTKRAVEKALIERGCFVKKFPFNATAEEILEFAPDGILLSPGPGEPNDKTNESVVKMIKKLVKSNVPIFGICMGHLLLALANGLKTRKLKSGHRSTNQPIKELSTGKVFITSQNHGYEVIASNCSMVNVNDNSCEGIDYGKSFSVQFHPEAHGGPKDTMFLFDRFVERMGK
ncbi:MAG: carbamoyl phosphate synthase small subunit [Firmicutes bacterium]|nr:carbamoyl phosphate synthase small subunit [Bacillota bacterium]